MLTLPTKERQLVNEQTLEIVRVPAVVLKMEHSLISISKWESIWHEAFLKDRHMLGGEFTDEMFISYMQCMTLNGPFDPLVYVGLSNEEFAMIGAYMEDPMTATKIKETRGPAIGGITTSEEIYCSMFQYRIPKDCEKWHINRLLMLIRVFNERENPKKLSQKEAMQQMYNKNAYRQAKARSRRR